MGLTVRVKALWFALVVVITCALAFAGVLALVAQPPHPHGSLLWLGAISLAVFVSGPLFLGSLVVFWDARHSVEARRFLSVALWIVLGLDGVAAVAIVVYAVLAGAAPWLPIAFVATGAALTALVLILGPRIGRRVAARAPRPAVWTPVSRAEVVSKVRTAAVTLVATFVVSSAALLVALPGEAAAAVRVSAQLACSVGAVVLVVFALSLSNRVRDIMGRDLGRMTAVARVVLSGRPAELDDDERVAAAKYASVMPVVLAFQTAYLGLIVAGLGIQSLGLVGSAVSAATAVPIAASFVVVVAVVMPLMLTRIRRASRYAREHAALLPAGG